MQTRTKQILPRLAAPANGGASPRRYLPYSYPQFCSHPLLKFSSSSRDVDSLLSFFLLPRSKQFNSLPRRPRRPSTEEGGRASSTSPLCGHLSSPQTNHPICMTLLWDALLAILEKPTIAGVLSELVLFGFPLWVAVIVGLLIGWSWKPKWAGERMGVSGVDPGMNQVPCSEIEPKEGECERNGSGGDGVGACVEGEDLERLRRLVEGTDGGAEWVAMMDRVLPAMSYRAWRREPKGGPPEYHSRTVFEDATPEIVRDFFWDDEFRIKSKWDDMLICHETLEECPITGTMIVQWVRKFPFFCSNREYIIGRRIWKLEGSYYCVTKGVPCPSVPRRNKPRRVDLYYSSWCIRPVESGRGDGKKTACEVLLFHHEDMGIPWEIAKLGIRQGMWGAVKKIEPGLRAYQIARKTSSTTSRCTLLAQINTKVTADGLHQLEPETSSPVAKRVEEDRTPSLFKFLMVGGAIILACAFDRGLLAKATMFGVGRRFARSVR